MKHGRCGMVWAWVFLVFGGFLKSNAENPQQAASENGLLSSVVARLRDLPYIGNMLRASVHPLFQPLVRPFQPRIHTREGDEESAFTRQCYGELGCLDTHPDFFHPLHRPFNLPPNTREEVGVVFTVYTRLDPKGTAVPAFLLTQLVNTSFIPNTDTKIIIHGFLDHTGITWIMDMMRALLSAGDYNVVTVDWSGGSQQLYSQATANTRLVGLEVAHFINWLKERRFLEPERVHIIGHSLGAHTAGYTGEQVPGLGRITGLDPAEPFFEHMPPRVRLDPSDAAFVDVIHSDTVSILNLGSGSGYGLRQQVGHLDFYPNDGKDQPGCDSITNVPFTALTDGLNIYEGLDAAQKELIACSHNRAAKLFTDSILSKCPYLAFDCPSYQMYQRGECVECGQDGHMCARLGLHADTWRQNITTILPGNFTHKTLFLSTSAGPNFCLYHYLLLVDLGDPETVLPYLRGELKMSFILDDGNVEEFDLTSGSPMNLARGKTYSYFLYHYEDLSGTTEALVQWRYEADLFNPLSYCVLLCDSSLPLVRLTLISVDSRALNVLRSGETSKEETTEAVMCHKQGLDVVKLASESTVRVMASPACRTLNTTFSSHTDDFHNITESIISSGLESIASLFPEIQDQ